MWKGGRSSPTVGGIQDQIEDGRTGYLVEPRDLRQFGSASASCSPTHSAERMGEAARLRVRDLFLGPRHLGQYVVLLQRVLTATAARRSPDSASPAGT